MFLKYNDLFIKEKSEISQQNETLQTEICTKYSLKARLFNFTLKSAEHLLAAGCYGINEIYDKLVSLMLTWKNI